MDPIQHKLSLSKKTLKRLSTKWCRGIYMHVWDTLIIGQMVLV